MRALRPLPPDLSRRIDALARGWSGDPDIAAVYLSGSRGLGARVPASDFELAVPLRAARARARGEGESEREQRERRRRAKGAGGGGYPEGLANVTSEPDPELFQTRYATWD